MDYYVNWDDTWEVLSDREFDCIDEDVAFERFLAILKKAHGTYVVEDNRLLLRENYDLMDYQYSTSVIGSEDNRWKVENAKAVLDKIMEERAVLDFHLDNVNDEFRNYDPLFLKLLYDRYFQGMKTEDIQTKYRINKKKYYAMMEASEYLFKNGLLLVKPVQAILDLVYGPEEDEKKDV